MEVHLVMLQKDTLVQYNLKQYISIVKILIENTWLIHIKIILHSMLALKLALVLKMMTKIINSSKKLNKKIVEFSKQQC